MKNNIMKDFSVSEINLTNKVFPKTAISYQLSAISYSESFLRVLKSALVCFSIVLLFFTTSEAQDYPKEIRGYKVHKAKVTVKTEGDSANKNDDAEAFVTLDEPAASNVSITGVSFEMSAKISEIEQSGKIEFLTFNDFKVNGLDVNIEEYTESFSFEKNKPFELPKPIKIFVGIRQTLMGSLGEIRDSKDEWDVSGTVFVFGKFKKFGFSFKRVIPVPVNVKIKNPLKKYRSQNSLRERAVFLFD